MKYIIVKHHDIEMAILFDEILTHKQVAGDRHVVAAGNCNSKGDAYGNSISLGINGRPEDSAIIKQSIARTI